MEDVYHFIKDFSIVGDITFWGAAYMSLNVDAMQKNFAYLVNDVIYPAYLDSAEPVPERWKRNIRKMAPDAVLLFIRGLLVLSACFTVATMDKRANILTSVYLFYSSFWFYSLLHDVIKDDDKSAYSAQKKRAHVLIPLNLESLKILKGRDLHPKQVEKQIQVLERSAFAPSKSYRFGTIMEFFISTIVMAFTANSPAPGWLKAFVATVYYPLASNFFSFAFQWLSLIVLKNKFPAISNDNFKLLMENNRVYEHGLQYEYFRNTNTYFNTLLHNNVFKQIKKYEGGSRKAKFGSIMARGLIVITMFFMLFGIEVSNAMSAFIYYSLHAAFAYYHHDRNDLGDSIVARFAVAIVEFFLCSFLWSGPLLIKTVSLPNILARGPDLLINPIA